MDTVIFPFLFHEIRGVCVACINRCLETKLLVLTCMVGASLAVFIIDGLAFGRKTLATLIHAGSLFVLIASAPHPNPTCLVYPSNHLQSAIPPLLPRVALLMESLTILCSLTDNWNWGLRCNSPAK